METSAGWNQWQLWPGRVRGYATTQSVVESTSLPPTPSTGSVDPSTGCHQPAWTSPDDQMDGYHLRTPDESMSMECTDSHSEDEDSHAPHVV